MFGINLKDLRIREYTCSPAVVGRANVAFGAAYGAVVAVLLPVCGLPDVWSTAFLVASPLCLVLWGLYCWKLRRRPVKRQVTLGGPAHRLYVRSRWMFVVYGLVCACVEYAIVMALVSLLSLAIMLGAGFLATRVTKKLHLPNVTGYLLAGIAIGPYLLNLIPPIIFERMEFVTDLALAFIAAYSMAGWLALIFVIIIPVLALALFGVIRKVVPVFRRIFRKYDALASSASTTP